MTVVNMRSRKPYKTSPVNDVDVGQTKDWVIKKLLARWEVSRLIAPPKAGKSAVAASICNHVAAGIDFHGLKIKQRSSVLYFALERPGLTRRRLIAEQRQMALGELPIHICEERVALANKADAQTMIDTILEVGDQYRLPVGLIVIDTSAKLIANGGGDENLARDVANVWSWLTLVRSETGVHSMIVGHKGKNGSKGERGSSATLGDADMVLTVDGEAAKTLSITEANDADCGPVFSFEMDKYVFGTDEDGDEDCVHIVGKEVAAPETRESGGLLKNDKTMLQILWDSQGMTKELWNAAARDAGIGNSRRAELHDIRVRLKDLKLVREYNGIWRAVKS